MNWAIRHLELQDESLPFVMGSWRKHCRSVLPFSRYSLDDYNMAFEDQRYIISSHPTLIAHTEEDKHSVLGFACGHLRQENQILYFIYVKDSFRQQKIGTALLETLFPKLKIDPIYLVYPGHSTKHLIEKWKLRVNPYIR